MQKLLADLEAERSRAKQAEATAEERRAALEAALKAKNELQAVDPLSFNEAETRTYLIDQMLADEGWDVGKGSHSTSEVVKRSILSVSMRVSITAAQLSKTLHVVERQ
jgi:hypothetical protein